MSISRGTTPTFKLTFCDENLDLTQAANVYVTFKYGNDTMTKTGEEIEVEEKSVSVYLTQAETLAFPVGPLEIQVNWTDGEGGRAASEIVTYPLSRQLLDEVL